MKSKLNAVALTFLLLLISMAWPNDSRSEDTALLCSPEACPEPSRTGDAQRLLRPPVCHSGLDPESRITNLRLYLFCPVTPCPMPYALPILRSRNCVGWMRFFVRIVRLLTLTLTPTLILQENLAEVGKPKSNWELQGILGLAVFMLGFWAGK